MRYKTEVFDLWQHLCRDVYDPLIRCRIDFEGFVDEEILRRAVTVSIKTIPMIGLCFGGGRFRPRWTDKGFTGSDIVSVIESALNPEKDILKYLSGVIDFPNEPQLKIFVVRRAEGDTLCVIISHIACDGAGFKHTCIF